jgi:hypothetical protein
MKRNGTRTLNDRNKIFRLNMASLNCNDWYDMVYCQLAQI